MSAIVPPDLLDSVYVGEEPDFYYDIVDTLLFPTSPAGVREDRIKVSAGFTPITLKGAANAVALQTHCAECAASSAVSSF